MKHVVVGEVRGSPGPLPVGKVSRGQSALLAGALLGSVAWVQTPLCSGFLSAPKVGKPHFYLGRLFNTLIINSQVMML